MSQMAMSMYLRGASGKVAATTMVKNFTIVIRPNVQPLPFRFGLDFGGQPSDHAAPRRGWGKGKGMRRLVYVCFLMLLTDAARAQMPLTATSNQVGNYTYTNFSDGSSATSNRIGNSTYTSFSPGVSSSMPSVPAPDYSGVGQSMQAFGEALGSAGGGYFAMKKAKRQAQKWSNDLCEIGEAQIEAGDVEAAKKSCIEASKIYVGWRQYRLAGLVSAGLGHFTLARVHLEHARAINEKDVRTRGTLALVYKKLGKRETAQQMASALLKVSTSSPDEKNFIKDVAATVAE